MLNVERKGQLDRPSEGVLGEIRRGRDEPHRLLPDEHRHLRVHDPGWRGNGKDVPPKTSAVGIEAAVRDDTHRGLSELLLSLDEIADIGRRLAGSGIEPEE